MKNEKDKKILEFNAIPLWEIGMAFLVMLVLSYGITEYVIFPLTKRNTAIQTQLIIFTMILVGCLYILFQHKRTNKLQIFTDKIDKNFSYKNNSETIRTLKIHNFLLKKLTGRFLRINNHLFLIMHLYKSPFAKVTKEQKITFKDDVNLLLGYSIKKQQDKFKTKDYIPIIINIMFYLLIIIALLLALFILIAIITDNTQWFNYFR